ncbi:contact-dependent growth inhibition system immunity protein [Jatrophihabitans sp. YIM 134969]
MTGFQILTSAYLGQDWTLYGATSEEAIAAFLRDEDQDDVTASIGGFEDLLAAELTEDEYYQRWIFALHSGYDPRDDGYTFRDWFAHALELLRRGAARGPGGAAPEPS